LRQGRRSRRGFGRQRSGRKEEPDAKRRWCRRKPGSVSRFAWARPREANNRTSATKSAPIDLNPPLPRDGKHEQAVGRALLWFSDELAAQRFGPVATLALPSKLSAQEMAPLPNLFARKGV